MDDLSPDIIFMLPEKWGGDEFAGVICNIVLGANILLCEVR